MKNEEYAWMIVMSFKNFISLF